MALDSTDTLKAILDAFNDHDLDAIMRKMVMIGAICGCLVGPAVALSTSEELIVE